MEEWIATVLDERGWNTPLTATWPKASSYTIEHDPKNGPVLRGVGPITTVDLTLVDPVRELAAAQGGERLLRAVNTVGLTVRPHFEEKRLRLRPVLEMPLHDFERDVREVRNAAVAYRDGFMDPAPVSSEKASNARGRFNKMAWGLARTAHTDLLGWAPVALPVPKQGYVHFSGSYGWGLQAPSLKELALARLVALAEDRAPLRQCPQCGELFARPEPRPGAKGKYVRKDATYCSQSCAQKAWYERNKKGSR